MGKSFGVELKGAGVRRPKFHEVGQSFTGYLLGEPEEQQALKYGTSDPDFWPDGKPRMQKIYHLLKIEEGPDCSVNCHYCKMSNPRDDEDTGERKIFAAWSQHKAIQQAFADAHKRDGKLQLGGQLTIRYAADDMKNKQTGKSAPKVWLAEYKNPTRADDKVVEDFLSNSSSDAPGMQFDEYE